MGLGPGDELAGVAAVGPGQLDGGESSPQIPQQRLCRVAVLNGAAVISTASSSPRASTATCRFVPLIFCRRRSRGGCGRSPPAFTDWESMIAAVGAVVRPAASRMRSRRSSCIRSADPPACHFHPPIDGAARDRRQRPPHRPIMGEVTDRIDDVALHGRPGGHRARPATPGRAVTAHRPPIPPRSCPRDSSGRGCCGRPRPGSTGTQPDQAPDPGGHHDGWQGRTARKAPGIALASTPKRLPGASLRHVSDTPRYAQTIQTSRPTAAAGFSSRL